MSDNKNMSLFGVGPLFVVTTMAITVALIVLSAVHVIGIGVFKKAQIPLIIFGVIFILFGIFVWVEGAVVSKLDKHIKENKLVQNGIYNYTRNPVYMAFLFVETGMLMCTNCLIVLVAPVVFYVSLTILLINTEEKWLLEAFGDEYLQYKKRVNRCIPWFPKKTKNVHRTLK